MGSTQRNGDGIRQRHGGPCAGVLERPQRSHHGHRISDCSPGWSDVERASSDRPAFGQGQRSTRVGYLGGSRGDGIVHHRRHHQCRTCIGYLGRT